MFSQRKSRRYYVDSSPLHSGVKVRLKRDSWLSMKGKSFTDNIDTRVSSSILYEIEPNTKVRLNCFADEDMSDYKIGFLIFPDKYALEESLVDYGWNDFSTIAPGVSESVLNTIDSGHDIVYLGLNFRRSDGNSFTDKEIEYLRKKIEKNLRFVIIKKGE